MNNNTAIMGLLEQTLNMHSNDDDDKKQVESSREQAEAQSSGETIYMDPAGTCEDPQQVAKEAIKTQDINFPRYCA